MCSSLIKKRLNFAISDCIVCVLQNDDLVKDLFSSFGDIIGNLYIQFDHVSNETAAILNEKCSESLEKLYLINLEGYLVNFWKNPFKNVKELTLANTRKPELFDKSEKLCDFFPGVEKLSIHDTVDWTFLDSQFKSVKFVELSGSPDFYKQDHQIHDFFENNPQTETFAMQEPSLKFLDYVAQLPKLNYLKLQTITQSFSDSNAVHFKSLKSLKIKSFSNNFIPNGIICENLVELILDFTFK